MRQLKADSGTRNIPVIVLTVFAMVGNEERAREAGCDGYVSKPIDVDTFIETILGFLNDEGKKKGA